MAGLRVEAIEFLIQAAQQLQVSPVVKYTALSLFAHRFLPSLSRFVDDNDERNWLLQPIRESNLQLFALVAIWISSKVGNIHDPRALSVKSLKSLGDKIIQDQHFITRDLLKAEVLMMQVVNFEISSLDTTFSFLEEILIKLKEVAKVGEVLNFEACMEIMDLLYEKEEISLLSSSPCLLAGAILVASYLITVPKQKLEFPILPWVNFVTSYKEEHIAKVVRDILKHIFEPS
ncbi:Cyclin, N-terminal [Dillenia turbinata]|uniref:Cyclin, N-terminal n=1 Tax=Dillenia turbinata TaxID=194707 RepID=A0AAN8VH94_9MAGN